MILLRQLNEQVDAAAEIEQLINAVRGAKEFFEQAPKDSWLWRGLRSTDVPQRKLFQMVETRTDRKPADSKPIIHQKLDDRMYQDFGIRFRSNVVFVLSNRYDAEEYGKSCIVLPQDPMKFCYGRNSTDAYNKFNLSYAYDYIVERGGERPELENLPRATRRVQGAESEFLDYIKKHPPLMSLFDEWFEFTYQQSEFTTENLAVAMKSTKEIMVNCPSYGIVVRYRSVPGEYILAANRALNLRLDPDEPITTEEFMGWIRSVV